jgi:MazG family protein
MGAMAPYEDPKTQAASAPIDPDATGTAQDIGAADTGELFRQSVGIMARLRGPDGCPWDREQSPESIRAYTLEETYEVLDAIERKHPQDLCEELGDLLLQVIFYAQMASDADEFTIADVLTGLNRKLVRRHPHVFGVEAAVAAGMHPETTPGAVDGKADAVVANWGAIKRMEKSNRQEALKGRMDGVLRSQPALLEAQKLGSAAAKCGFDWPDPNGLLEKIQEEAAEVVAEFSSDGAASKELHLEVGDLLFVTANLARHLKVSPEMALRDASAKFRSRFAAMEKAERSDGGPLLEARSLDDLESLWNAAKQQEREEAVRGESAL